MRHYRSGWFACTQVQCSRAEHENVGHGFLDGAAETARCAGAVLGARPCRAARATRTHPPSPEGGLAGAAGQVPYISFFAYAPNLVAQNIFQYALVIRNLMAYSNIVSS